MLKLIGIFSVVGFSESIQRIFRYGDSQNTSLTPDNKEPDIFMYCILSYVIMYTSCKQLLKMVHFCGLLCIITMLQMC